MNCDRCQHTEEARAILAPCQVCAEDKRRCNDCPVLAEFLKINHFCVTCEAGRLHGQVSTDASAAADRAYLRADPAAPTHAPSVRATDFSPETEDALRQLTQAIFDLDPLELLLLRQVVHMKTYTSLKGVLLDLRNRLNSRYNLDDEESTAFKAIVSIWAQNIQAKLPGLKGLFDAAKLAGKTQSARR